MPKDDAEAISADYLRFAEEEARGRSPLYEAFARAVARDAEILRRLAGLPPHKRQPNLLLAAVRHVAGVAADQAAFRRAALARWPEVEAVMLARATQTNEPGRCATLLPVLAHLPQPLALIEVGASAGLCLLPDRYAYSYDGREVRGAETAAGAPAFPCRMVGPVPLPATLPRVVWRAGLDLDPIDVADKDSTAWLETLVWPEATERADRLRAALAVARDDPPRIVRGDLLSGLEMLAAEAPADATLVVFHTAVLMYVSDPAERAAFATSVGQVCDHWVSNEPPGAFPEIAARARAPRPPGNFLLALDGEPVAWTDPHGATMLWLGNTRRTDSVSG